MDEKGGGIGFFGLLQVVMVALKFTDHIDSWKVALIPTWIVLFVILLYVIGFIVFVATGKGRKT